MATIISKKQIKGLAKVFKKHQVIFAYLFGSRATGQAIRESDFDIAVMLPQETNPKKRFSARCKMITETASILKNEKIEIAVINDIKSTLFRFVIIKEGVVIYENNHKARVFFELKTMNDYYDFSRFIEEYNQAYLKRELTGVRIKRPRSRSVSLTA